MSGFMKLFFLLIKLNRLQQHPTSPLLPLYPSLYILSCNPLQSLHHCPIHCLHLLRLVYHYLHVIMIILQLQVQIRHTHRRRLMLLPAPLVSPLFASLLWVLLLLGLSHGLRLYWVLHPQVLSLFPLLELTYVLIYLSSIFSTSPPLSPLHLSGLAPIQWCFTHGQKKMLILALWLSHESRPYLSRSHCHLRT